MSVRDLLFSVGPLVVVVIIALIFLYKHIDPAPPSHLTMATGDDQSDLDQYAKEYQRLLKQDGVTLNIRPSKGPIENLHLLEDDSANVDVAFVQDGLGSPDEQKDVVSLGSLYYQPLWVFYRSSSVLNHLSQLEGKKIAVGRLGHGTHILAKRLLRLSGVDMKKTQLINIDSTESMAALEKGSVDAAILLMSPQNPIVHELAINPHLKMMNILQAEGISRKDASYHHLVLPRGSLDLAKDIPRDDVNLLASTTTLLVRDDLHPALAYLLLKAATEIHSEPGLLEKRGEFPANKDDQFPLSDDALQYYKSGGPFWQRYLPYWLAAWVDRFFLLVIPILAVVLPLLRAIPRLYQWRIRSRIYQRYGELKFIETQMQSLMASKPLAEIDFADFRHKLDVIEDRVNKMKVPKNFTEYIFSLLGHIQFVRDRMEKFVATEG